MAPSSSGNAYRIVLCKPPTPLSVQDLMSWISSGAATT